jgi:hypothetical protein
MIMNIIMKKKPNMHMRNIIMNMITNTEKMNIIMNMKKPEKVMQPARSYSRRQMPKLSVCRRKK